MPYYMKHPEHGFHICYTPEDVEQHKKIGWVPVDIDQPTKPAPVVVEPPKKRGRHPKGK